MEEQVNQVFFPVGYPELFAAWEHNPSAVLFAGGTALIREQDRHVLDIPPIIISLNMIEEMQKINRSERFLEIGAMVKLSQIIDLGKTVPVVLRKCLEGIAGIQLRNMATIGGNICYSGRRLDSSAVLAALNAQYELRSSQTARWISASRFSSMPGLSALGSRELLTRIRVPLDAWDYAVYKKFSWQSQRSRTAVFMVKTQKNILNDIRIVYKNDSIWRDTDSESILIGKHLPLSKRITADFVNYWNTSVAEIESIDELSRLELINFIEVNITALTE